MLENLKDFIMKEKIVIITDTCSSLTKEECEKRNIICVETSYVLDDEEHLAFDEPNVSLVEFYEKLDAAKSVSTGCVSEAVFEETFEKTAKDGLKAIYMGLSGALSATYGYAQVAAEKINEKYGKKVIGLVNSRTGSIGVQILLDDAEELIAQGKTLDELEFILKDYASKLESVFICRDLKFLHKCGRLSSFEAGLGTLLKIVPLIHVDPKDDKLRVQDKCLGKKLAYKTLKNKFVKLINERPCEKCYIASCGLDEDAEELKNHIISNTHIKDIKVGYIDKTMSCCCGPKTIAIFVR